MKQIFTMLSMENHNIKIEIKINASDNYEEFLLEAKAKKIHIACVASLEEERYCFKCFKDLVTGLEISKIKSSIKKVINLKEVGTLYPDAYLSFLPPVEESKDNDDSIFTAHISELIFEANEKYIKAPCIVIMLDNHSIDYKRISQSIDKAISENWKKIKWLKKIILF